MGSPRDGHRINPDRPRHNGLATTSDTMARLGLGLPEVA